MSEPVGAIDLNLSSGSSSNIPSSNSDHEYHHAIDASIETRTLEIGQKIFRRSRKLAAGLFNQGFWQEKMMKLTTGDPRVKIQLFRFVDVLPVLKSERLKREHLIEYLSAPDGVKSWPWLLKLATSLLKSPLQSGIVKTADRQVKSMGDLFIVGKNPEEILPRLQKLRQQDVSFTLDILGEAVLSEAEAKEYREQYERIIDYLGESSSTWSRMKSCDYSAKGEIPKVNVSIKVSAFDSLVDPVAQEVSISRLQERIEPLLRKAMKWGVFINFDMEQYSFKELTRELFKRILMKPEFKDYPFFGVVNQAYLKCSREDIKDWIRFAETRGCPFTIRLVKGAYWDYETIVANQNQWPCPVFEHKWESDLCFENCATMLLDNYPKIELAAASHNIRSLAYTMAYAEHRKLPKNSFEIQMLHGMSGAFKSALVEMGMRVREYCPMGDMLPGLSYLVRRLLENTANDSFLRQSFMDGREIKDLLRHPSLNRKSASKFQVVD